MGIFSEMSLEKRAVITTGYTLVFIIVFLAVINYFLDASRNEIKYGIYACVWVIVAFSFHDLMVSYIMGNDGFFLRPISKTLKKKLSKK